MKRLLIVACLVYLALVFWLPRVGEAQAVRVSVGGGCGSGWAAGRDDRGTFVLTNAHVAGTELGRQVNVDVPTESGVKRVPGRVVMAAYESRQQTDWAVVLVPNLTGPVWPLSIDRPVDRAYASCGAPRCAWPLVCFTSRDNQISGNSPLWTWLPSSIGGQSGSAMVADGVAFGLLTWQINGRGGGQQTSWIHRQATAQSSDSVDRVPGMVDVGGGVVCEDGFFAESGINELPIWAGQSPVDPVPVEPSPDDSVGPLLKRLCQRLGLEPGECALLLKLILRLLE